METVNLPFPKLIVHFQVKSESKNMGHCHCNNKTDMACFINGGGHSLLEVHVFVAFAVQKSSQGSCDCLTETPCF